MPSNTESLFQAAEEGNCLAILRLIRQGTDVNARNGEKMTPLHVAALNGRDRAVNALREKGADVNAREPSCGSTPLHMAAHIGHVPTILALTAGPTGANVNAEDFDGNTPLDLATHTEAVRVLQAMCEEAVRNVRGEDGDDDDYEEEEWDDDDYDYEGEEWDDNDGPSHSRSSQNPERRVARDQTVNRRADRDNRARQLDVDDHARRGVAGKKERYEAI